MKRLSFQILTVLTLQAYAFSAEGSPAQEKACEALGSQQKKCADHARIFEVETALIHDCVKSFKDTDDRMACIKSGSSPKGLAFCKHLAWSTENTLTCLRLPLQNSALQACRGLSGNEETQVACARYGRELSQIDACKEWGMNDKDRLECLRWDAPAAEIRTCNRREKSRQGKKICLHSYTTMRDKENDEQLAADVREANMRVAQERQATDRIPASKKSATK